MASNNNSGYKRRFPKIGKCFCCCCFSPKTSVIVCTVLFLIYCVYYLYSYYSSLFSSINNFNIITKVLPFLVFGVYICVVVTLILLIIGIVKVKLSYVRPFKIVILVYLIVIVIDSIYGYILYGNSDYVKASVDETMELIKTDPEYQKIYGNSDINQLRKMFEESFKYLKFSILLYLVIILVVVGYYYLTTCCYIEDLEEEEMNENDARYLEDDAY